VQEQLHCPIIHIGDATAEKIIRQGIKKVVFLGTKYTMTEDFLTQRIANKGIEVLAPEQPEVVEELHRIIIEELTYGKIIPKSKKYVLDIIQSFEQKGVQGIVLGCTEFPLMIEDADVQIPIFNTTEIHAKAGVNFILEDVNNDRH